MRRRDRSMSRLVRADEADERLLLQGGCEVAACGRCGTHARLCGCVAVWHEGGCIREVASCWLLAAKC